MDGKSTIDSEGDYYIINYVATIRDTKSTQRQLNIVSVVTSHVTSCA